MKQSTKRTPSGFASALAFVFKEFYILDKGLQAHPVLKFENSHIIKLFGKPKVMDKDLEIINNTLEKFGLIFFKILDCWTLSFRDFIFEVTIADIISVKNYSPDNEVNLLKSDTVNFEGYEACVFYKEVSEVE